MNFVKHFGDVHLHENLILTDTLHVPTFKFNLLSVSRLTKALNLKFVFIKDHCLLQDLLTEKILAVGSLIKNLYILDQTSFYNSTIESFISADCNVFLSNNSSLDDINKIKDDSVILWHRRLGHVSGNVMQHLKMVNSFDKNVLTPCDICSFSKQYRLSFRSCEIKTSDLFEILHVDLWGP